MDKIFFLYIPFFLSLSFYLLFHVFKRHIHSFCLATIFNTSNAIDKLHFKCQHPNTSIPVLDSPPYSKPSLSLPPSIGFIDATDERIKGLKTCTENLNFESQVSVEMDDNDNNNDKNEDSLEVFPPPLSSMSGNGQPNFILQPVRENGRLQLSKVRIKRPEILHARRQDGRLRLFLVPDQCILDDEEEEEEENEKLVEEQIEEEKEIITDWDEELEENDEEVGEEIVRSEEKCIREREWENPNTSFRRCHEVVSHIHYHHVHGSYLRMYRVGIV